MQERMTTAEFRRTFGPDKALPPKSSGKYRNTIVIINGKRFDSKLEGNYYIELLRLQKIGVVSYFHMQVPIELSMNSKDLYRLDFQVFYPDKPVEYIDTKGVETKVFKLKKNLIEGRYPFKLKLLKSKDVPKHLDTLVPNQEGKYVVKW